MTKVLPRPDLKPIQRELGAVGMLAVGSVNCSLTNECLPKRKTKGAGFVIWRVLRSQKVEKILDFHGRGVYIEVDF